MKLIDALFIPAIDGIAYGLVLFVVGSGLTLCFGVAKILNLAHGTLYTLGAYCAAAFSDGTWPMLVICAIAGSLVSAIAGGTLACLVTPIATKGYLGQALLTFGLALIVGDVLIAVFGAHELPIHLPLTIDKPMNILGHHYPTYRLIFIIIAIVIAVGLFLAITKTRYGSIVRAAVDDPDMLACTGINPFRVRMGVLVGAGTLAGLAGALGAPIIGPGPGTAGKVLTLSLVVVVLGGLGSIGGAMIAAITIGEIHTLGVTLLPSVAPFLMFAAIAGVLALRAHHSGMSRRSC